MRTRRGLVVQGLHDPHPRRPVRSAAGGTDPEREERDLGGPQPGGPRRRLQHVPRQPGLQPIAEAFDECDSRAYGDGDEVNEPTHHNWTAQAGHVLRKRDHTSSPPGPSRAPRFTACDVDRSRMDTTENRPDSGPPDGYSDHAPIIGYLKAAPHAAEAAGDFNGDGKADLACSAVRAGRPTGATRAACAALRRHRLGLHTAPRRVWDSGTEQLELDGERADRRAISTATERPTSGVLYDYGRNRGPGPAPDCGTFKGTRRGEWRRPASVTGTANDTTTPTGTGAPPKPVAADFDGDGRRTDDVVRPLRLRLLRRQQPDGTVRVFTSARTGTGIGFKNPRLVWDSLQDPVRSWNWAASKPGRRDYFDGDGKADLGVLYNYGRTADRNRTGLWTFTATASGFGRPRQVWDSGTDSWNWAASKPVTGRLRRRRKGRPRGPLRLRPDRGPGPHRLWTFSGTASG
ncbi:hypothetical protein ACFSNO_31735, partial [Streptomyces cirratus]